MYGWLHFCRLGGQKIVHIQQFVVFGCAGQIVPRVVGGGVVVRDCAAVLGAADVGMLEQIVFVVHHRTLPSDEQDSLAVVQQPHLVRGHKVAPGLLVVDLSLLLSQPDASTRQGLRDLTLLALLYDSGARVQELVDLRLKDVRLTHPPMVILTGKGRKVRQVPLMKDTCKLLDRYIRSFHSDSQSQMIPLFYNAKKQALSRYGVTYILKKYAAKASPVLEPQNISPHVLRHTKAMHLLRAGVNMIYIRDFLGHADISTTEVYARIDAEMKRKVFEEKVPNYTPNTTMPWEEDEDLLQWLTQFGKKTF